MAKKENAERSWPRDCVWPEPLYDDMGLSWYAEDIEATELDEEGEDLMDVREYFDYLVECGRLNDDYTWNYNYKELDEEYPEFPEDPEDFSPDAGAEYWSDRFEYEMWEDDLSDHYNCLKIAPSGFDTIIEIEEIIDYRFINENLLRQAFTRRSFAAENGLSGCNEELELVGDAVLNNVITREIVSQLTDMDTHRVDAPFASRYREGDLSRIRSSFVSGEFLSAKAEEHGLSKFILYGESETPGASANEDMMEALIGAVMVDSGWNWDVAESLVDRLLCVQLGDPDRLLQKTYFEIFNSWHQKHFGMRPDYTIDGRDYYTCIVRFNVPPNDRDIWTSQIQYGYGHTRSQARELAAELAYRFVMSNGLWTNISEAGITPDPENSINQLQELYQKKYLESAPEYQFYELPDDRWRCRCSCAGIQGYGVGNSKTKAKKAAAFEILSQVMIITCP